MKSSLEILEPLRDAVHVWLLPSDRQLSPKLIAEYRDLLSRDEADHYSRLRASRPRRQFLLGRALARTTLSRYAKIAPEKWIFRANPHGRPEIAGPAGYGDLRFNLSHTGGLVACLVACGIEAGIDVEEIGQARRPVALAASRFAPTEAAALRSMSADSLDERFCSFWTLKEAYIKARGVGIALGLQRFAFALGSDGGLDVAFEAELDDREGDWQFALFRASEKHMLAVALRTGGGRDRPIVVREVLPLTDDVRVRNLQVLAAT